MGVGWAGVVGDSGWVRAASKGWNNFVAQDQQSGQVSNNDNPTIARTNFTGLLFRRPQEH